MEAFDLLVLKLTGWFEQLVLLLPNLVVALVVVAIFWLLAAGSRNVLTRVLPRMSRVTEINQLLASTVYLAVILTGGFVALGVLGLDKTVMSLLAGVGIVGLVLGLAFQEVASNLVAGVFISLRRPFTTGHVIEVAGFTGQVERVRLRSTELRTGSGKLVLIPNKTLFEGPLTNLTLSRPCRVDVKVGVSYDQDLATVRRVATAALDDVPRREPAREIEVLFDELADSAVVLVASVWVDGSRPMELARARSAIVERLKEAFDREGIDIPYPTHAVRLDGETRRELGAALREGGRAAPRAELSRRDEPSRRHH